VVGTGQFQAGGLYAGSAWDALDFATAEGLPDNLISLIASQRELVLGGDKSIEIWFNCR
jgi:hypothetical protein